MDDLFKRVVQAYGEAGLSEADALLQARLARILRRGEYNEPTLWALVDPDAPMESRRIRTYGTGGRVPDNLEWLGTFQLDGGGLVFHAFEEVKA